MVANAMDVLEVTSGNLPAQQLFVCPGIKAAHFFRSPNRMRKLHDVPKFPCGAAAVKIPEDIRHILSKYSKSRTLPARQVQRARIILLAADGKNNMQIWGIT